MEWLEVFIRLVGEATLAKKRKDVKVIQVSENIKDNSLRVKPECFGEWCEFCDKELCGGWFSRCYSLSIEKK